MYFLGYFFDILMIIPSTEPLLDYEFLQLHSFIHLAKKSMLSNAFKTIFTSISLLKKTIIFDNYIKYFNPTVYDCFTLSSKICCTGLPLTFNGQTTNLPQNHYHLLCLHLQYSLKYVSQFLVCLP